MGKQSKIGFSWQFAALLGLTALAALVLLYREQAAGLMSGAENQAASEKKGRRKGGRKTPVIVARVAQRSSAEILSSIGTARALRSVTLFTPAAGEIKSLPHRAGARLKKSQMILELDARQARLAAELAEAKLKDAQRALSRAQKLKRKRIVSQTEYDAARLAAENADIELRQARENLVDRSLRAPFNGVLGIPMVEPGDRVKIDTPIITLDDRSSLLVEFVVPERYIARIKKGMKAIARTPGFPDRTFEGRIDRIDSRIDVNSRSLKLRAALPNKKDLLRPGMSFVMELDLSGKDYPAVPELALQWRKGESYVWLVRDGKAQKTIIRAVRRLNATVLIDGEVKPGDLVVIEGVQRLRPGRAVSYGDVRKEQPEAGS